MIPHPRPQPLQRALPNPIRRRPPSLYLTYPLPIHHRPLTSHSHSHPAPPHHDLPSFLSYARTHSLSPSSTVYAGTYYEYLCASALRRLSFSLTRTGGRSDAGIDLLGTWSLPSIPHPLRVLVQCKALKTSVAPEVVRELEGAAAGAPEGWMGERTVAVLCAKRPATRGVREAVKRARVPVLWAMVEDRGEGGGKVGQVLWNERVDLVGARGMAVGLRHVPTPLVGEAEAEGLEKECVLLWKGVPWVPQLDEHG